MLNIAQKRKKVTACAVTFFFLKLLVAGILLICYSWVCIHLIQ